MFKKKIKNLIEYFIYLDNPFSCLLFKFGIKKNCEINIKNNKKSIYLKNNDGFSINYLMNTLYRLDFEKIDDFIDFANQLKKDEEFINIGGVCFCNTISKTYIDEYTHIDEFFAKDFFLNDINVQNRVIIDIGANVADTALFAVKNGAKEVFSFEPVKKLYDLGVKNINLNNEMGEKIHLFNEAVSFKKGEIEINRMNSVNEYVDEEESYKIIVKSIPDILMEYNITPDILKMDCEGCEFEIIENEDLSIFNDIIFEHHSKIVNKDHKPLINKLRKEGFTISLVHGSGNFKEQGIIHAYK